MQSAGVDGFQKARRRTVIQHVRRHAGWQSKRNLDGMALIGANPLAIGAQCKTFLVAARNDGFDQGAVEAQTIGVSVGQSNQFTPCLPLFSSCLGKSHQRVDLRVQLTQFNF